MNKTALITGASGGLGAEFARIHASRGGDLVLVARSEDKLNALKKELEAVYAVSVYLLPKDLTVPRAPKEIYDELQQKGIRVECLINNAGFGDFGMFASCDWEKQSQMIQLNVTSLTYLTRLFLPQMIQNRTGCILNVASTAAFQPGPTMAVYFATKAYVLSFTEALSGELEGTGVTATALCPGATETGFKAAASLNESNLFKGSGIAGSPEVALFGYRAMIKGKRVVVHGFLNRCMAFGGKFVPRKLVLIMVRWMLRKN